MPRWLKTVLVLLAVLVTGATLSFGPLVRSRAEAQAERRGVALSIDAVRPGAGRVWLRTVGVQIPEMPAVRVELDHVEVQLSSSLDAKRIVVHGGTVRVSGSLDDVRRQLLAYAARRPRVSGSASSSTAAIEVAGLNVEWSGALAGGEPQRAWGVRYGRSGDDEALAADLVRVVAPGLLLEATAPRVELAREGGERRLKRVSTDAARVSLRTHAAAALVRDSTASNAQGETNTGRSEDDAGAERGPRLRRALGSVADAVALALPKDASLDLSGVRIDLDHDGQRLNLGPLRVRASHDGSVASLRVLPSADAPQPLRLSLGLPLGSGEVELSVAGGPVSLGLLGVREGDLGLSDVASSTVQADVALRLTADGRRVKGHGTGKLSKLALEQPWLAKQRVHDLELGLRGRGELALDGTRVDIEQGELTVGSVKLEAKGVIERQRVGAELHTTATLEGGIPLASCQAILDSLPAGLAPLLEGMRMSGTFSLTGRIELDTRRPQDVVTRWALANECRITAVPQEVSPRRFKASWTRDVMGAEGRLIQIQSGPGSLGWVGRHAISRHMETAVLVCEDGAFFRHNGFDQEAIRNSIRENLKARKFVRGASTISMQLAKNLYLPREKTVSRKLQEAWLTTVLEQELSKDELLELYLNVIEFGPGIYGIGSAAAHYFNTTASQLSLGQSLYLASVLPSPKRHYFGADGRVTPGWMGYLRRLMRIGHKIRRVTDAELEEALMEQVAFRVPYSPRAADAEASIAYPDDPDSAHE